MSTEASPAPATMQGTAFASLNSKELSEIQQIGDLGNKIALITGASSGLGRAMSQAFAAAGAFIVNADLTPNPPKTPLLEKTMQGSGRDYETPTVDLINKQYPSSDGRPRMAFVECNVTKAASVEGAVAFAVKTYGRLDIMINNAGVTAQDPKTERGRTHETDERLFNTGFDVNVKGVWLGIKYATAQMLKQEPHSSGDRGWIISLCSILGVVGMSNAAVYCGTKGEFIRLVRTAADISQVPCCSLHEPVRWNMLQTVYI